ncbi:MAG TPA: SAM-dependent methyltransferase [Streptosporangiaceae bacterium]|nr:SAM-dependent methyltransferase [Streptosporangiaceae bacterium]
MTDEPSGQDAGPAQVADIARMQDYWRGGTGQSAADASAAQQAMAAYPGLAASVRANRAFLGRAVRFLAGEAGMRQFLDIGTGLPAPGSVPEVARAVSAQCRVVCCDNDPQVVRTARESLAGAASGPDAFLQADLRDPAALLGQAGAYLDLTEPVAVLLVSVLHMVDDDDRPYEVVTALMGALAPGSFLALTHVASDIEPEAMAEMTRRVNSRVARRATPRDRAAVARFCTGLDLVPPGLVPVPQWRPDTPEEAASPSTQWGGIARTR